MNGGREYVAQNLHGAFFVLRERVGMQEADDHAIDVFAGQAVAGLGDGRLVQRHVDAAVGAPPLAHLEAQPPGHQRLRVVEMDVVDLGPDLTADLEKVAEPRAGDHGDAADAALDEGIGADRGAVRQPHHTAGIEPVLAQHRGDAVDDGPVRLLGRRRQLVADQPVLAGYADGNIGKGAPDVYSDMNIHPRGRRQ